MEQDIPTISFEQYESIRQMDIPYKMKGIGRQPDRLSVFLKQSLDELQRRRTWAINENQLNRNAKSKIPII